MDRQEPHVDQRQQLLAKRSKRGRSQAEWEEIALKVLLLHSEWAVWVRDNYSWQSYGRYKPLTIQTCTIMHTLSITGTCQPSTFVNSVARALRRLRREARQSLDKEARNRDYARDKQRGS